VAGVDGGVARVVREQAADGRYLLQVLAQVGLDVGVGVLLRERAGRRQLGLGRGEREARGDGVELAAAAVPALEERLALAVAPLSRVEQARRRRAVHQDFAGHHAGVRRWLAAKKASADSGCTVQ
jgi:hypothetical protein